MAKDFGYKRSELEEILSCLEVTILRSLETEDKIKVFDGLIITVEDIPARKFYNFQTKEVEDCPAQKTVKIKVPLSMKKAVRNRNKKKDENENY